MAAQLHNIAEFERDLPGVPNPSKLAGTGARIYQFPASVAAPTTDRPDFEWARGLRFALGVEFVGGLVLFAIWQLWRIAH